MKSSRVHTVATEQNLNNGPADMPDRGHGKPNLLSPSTRVTLGRTENHFAQAGGKPGHGKLESDNTSAPLSRTPEAPYVPLGATKPQLPFTGKKKR